MISRLVALVVGLSLLTPVLGQRVGVATWNLEWLGTPDRRADGLRTGPQLSEIADRIAQFDVAVLVEINTGSSQWRSLRNALRQKGWEFVEGTGGDQRVVIGYDTNDVEQISAFEAEIATEFRRPDPNRPGQNCFTGSARKPLISSFRSQNFDFTVVGVHLKSGRRPNSCRDDSFSEWVRSEQARLTLQAIEQGQASGAIDQDVIIIGDYNGGLSDESIQSIRAAGWSVLSDDNSRSSTSGSISFRKGRFQSKLDHISAPDNTKREWVVNSTVYFPDLTSLSEQELASYHRDFSDHALAYAEFDTTLPDDDGTGSGGASVSTPGGWIAMDPKCRCICAGTTAIMDAGGGRCDRLEGQACEFVRNNSVTSGQLSSCSLVWTNR